MDTASTESALVTGDGGAQAAFRRALAEHIAAAQALAAIEPQVLALIDLCAKALAAGNKLLLFGNGGSAAQASHIAAELVGRFGDSRRALPAIALTADAAILTALGNDYGFDSIFERQVEALAKKGDVAIGISTSGDSDNVRCGLEGALAFGCSPVLVTGRRVLRRADFSFPNWSYVVAPADSTPRIQELHLLIGHMLCEGIEARLFP